MKLYEGGVRLNRDEERHLWYDAPGRERAPGERIRLSRMARNIFSSARFFFKMPRAAVMMVVEGERSRIDTAPRLWVFPTTEHLGTDQNRADSAEGRDGDPGHLLPF